MFIGRLEPGDKVKIVDKWVGHLQNHKGLMDKYLGTVMTVKYNHGYSYSMVEDNGQWLWTEEMIDSEVTTDFNDNEKETIINMIL